MLRLAVRFDDKVRQYALPRAAVRLGSATENELHAPFPGVSRRHLEVSPHPEGVHVRDLGSKNGLVSAGRRVPEILLRAGDAVFVGKAQLILEDVPSSDAEAALALPRAVAGKVGEHGSGRRSRAGSSASDARATDRAPWVEEGPGRLSAAPALRLVRDLESGAPRAGGGELLRRSAEVLGCESLLVFSGAPDLVVVACHGPYPPEELLADLGPALARRRDAIAFHERALVGAGLAGEPALVARFAAGSLPLEPWQRDLFEYLAERLLDRAAIAPVESTTTDSPEVLRFPAGMVVGASPAMQGLLAHVRATIRSEMNVLLVGETGTGKELVARLIHASSAKARGPFVAVNCAAIPGELLEAELFGVAARVATGVDPRPGLFVQAHGGTLFLDEIGDMPERLQAKMLRVLQEHEVLPLGGAAAKKVDARVVAASNRDLARLVQEGAFRADLFYRLRGLQFHLPPLRERREDLPEMVLSFATRAAEKYGKSITGITRRALRLLLDHPWPGNVRELESEVERAVLLCADGGMLQAGHFGGIEWQRGKDRAVDPEALAAAAAATGLGIQVELVERAALRNALRVTGGNKTRAAQLLGLTRNGLAMKARRLGIDTSRPHDA